MATKRPVATGLTGRFPGTACREQALELLKRGWQPGSEPRYDPDQVLVLCRTRGFREGLIFLYEKLRLFREVLRVSPLDDSSLALHAPQDRETVGRRTCAPKAGRSKAEWRHVMRLCRCTWLSRTTAA